MGKSSLDFPLALFRNLFRGRDDVFALRWEKESRSGYMPAYFFDPYQYRAHKMRGGSFQSFQEKKYLPLTDIELVKHFDGEQHVGIYPLLSDNSSWFIAADFDENDWLAECRLFHSFLLSKNVPSYVERSRSGNGGHVWVFFERNYPAEKSRQLLLNLLVESGLISGFDKSASFDRLFPSQDSHAGKGLGNLIALPLNGKAIANGNSIFINPDSGESYPDQWNFLSGVKRISISQLDRLCQNVGSGRSLSGITTPRHETTLSITLDSKIRINRSVMPVQLVNFLKEELNIPNPEYFVKQKSGRSVFGTDRFFRFVQEANGVVAIPRGFAGRLLRYCKEEGIPYQLIDNRFRANPTPYSFHTELREFQFAAVAAASKKEMGVIVAPPGSGKTVVALKIISDKQQPALIIVHRKQLAEQWIERIGSFLGIPKADIGKIGQGRDRIGKQITIATIQSLSKALLAGDASGARNSFGTIIIDECHHVPAITYKDVIEQLNSFYLYGLTATPFRKYTDGKLIFIHLGEVISEFTSEHAGRSNHATIVIRHTDLDITFNPKTDRFETLSNILIHDSTRNRLIIRDVLNEVKSGNKVVILTERKEHIESLQQLLKASAEVISISGDDTEASRKAKWRTLNAGEYQILLTTGQFFGEGSDLSNASTVFLVYPFGFEGKLIQYIGRVQRSEIPAKVYDYRDSKIPYLERMFLKRNMYYRKIERQIDLFSDPVEEESSKPASNIFEKEIKIPIEMLEFIYGGVIFTYHVDVFKKDLVFEVQNDNLRPEFEVLKPYFSKALKSKNISVEVFAEMKDGQLISQSANSMDLSSLNQDLVEGLRFQFVRKNVGGRPFLAVGEDAEPLPNLRTDHPLYESGQELLNDVLAKGTYKHSVELRYFSEKHASNILKVRYLLHPFSFVFLVESSKMYHLALETLDTEEATYLWSFPNIRSELPIYLHSVESHLDLIRKGGRQLYLNSPPPNFSRLVHDYTDRQKGFILWRDELEEKCF